MHKNSSSHCSCAQVVTGQQYHITLATKDIETGETYTHEAVVHRDVNGLHTTKSSTPPEKNKSSSSDRGWIVGAVVGAMGLALVAAVVLIAWRSKSGSELYHWQVCSQSAGRPALDEDTKIEHKEANPIAETPHTIEL